MSDLVLPIGTTVLCIKDCYEEFDEETEELKLLYIKGKEYTSHLQGMIKDEEGCTRQWKKDWFTLTPEFHIYFSVIN